VRAAALLYILVCELAMQFSILRLFAAAGADGLSGQLAGKIICGARNAQRGSSHDHEQKVFHADLLP
jgi:hypothetical protein